MDPTSFMVKILRKVIITANMVKPTVPFQKIAVQNNAIRTMVLKLLAKNVFNMIIYVLRIFFSGFEKPTKLFPVHFRQNQANRYW